jgi:uncharacterized membrane protein
LSEPKLIQQERAILNAFPKIIQERATAEAKAKSAFESNKSAIDSEFNSRRQQLDADIKAQKRHLESKFDSSKTIIRHNRNDNKQSAENQLRSQIISLENEKSTEVQRIENRRKKWLTFFDYSAIPFMVVLYFLSFGVFIEFYGFLGIKEVEVSHLLVKTFDLHCQSVSGVYYASDIWQIITVLLGSFVILWFVLITATIFLGIKSGYNRTTVATVFATVIMGLVGFPFLIFLSIMTMSWILHLARTFRFKTLSKRKIADTKAIHDNRLKNEEKRADRKFSEIETLYQQELANAERAYQHPLSEAQKKLPT